jgi:hypothetical protein
MRKGATLRGGRRWGRADRHLQALLCYMAAAGARGAEQYAALASAFERAGELWCMHLSSAAAAWSLRLLVGRHALLARRAAYLESRDPAALQAAQAVLLRL